MAQNKHLLIIEDDTDMMEIMTAILEKDGYSVSGIAGADDIVRTVLEQQPDLVITDYILEVINGGEYCSQLKSNPLTRQIPVMIVSGYPNVLTSLGNYGADEVIYKPFDNADLSARVAALLA
ncbi:response regulator [Mucilaginibacter gynuensis]